MTKRDKLYTVNKWNKVAFVPDENLFSGGGPTGWDVNKYGKYNDKGGWFNLTKGANPFSKGNLALAGKAAVQGLAGTAATALGSFAGNAISGGLSSGAGTAISSIGGSLGASVGMVNPVAGAIIGVGSQLIGGLTNRAFGSKLNKGNIANVENTIANMGMSSKALTNSSSTADLLNTWGNTDLGFDFSNSYIGKDGWFSNKAKKKARSLRAQQNSARAVAQNALVTGAHNVDQMQDSMVMRNSAAFGGLLNTTDNMGAIEYDVMSDYLTNKKEQINNKNTIKPIYFGMPNGLFAYGGELKRKVREAKKSSRETKAKKRQQKNEQRQDLIAGIFGGGSTGGAGSTSIVGYPDTQYKEVKDTIYIPQYEDFNTAFNRARNAGLDTFVFDGKVYSTEMGDNPNSNAAGASRLNLVGITPLEITREEKIKNTKAEGGKLSTHGADFTDGMTQINTGGTHEQNPHDGVKIGVDPQGVPNLVEEGEVVYNDYVYSNRITLDDGTKKKFKLNKKSITYADAAKEIEKEIAERPNDPISKKAFEAQMTLLAEEQERQKKEMEAAKARAAFEALSPEEQTAIMQQAALQEQAMQEEAIQEQALAQEAALQEEAAALQQPTMEDAVMQEQLVQEPVVEGNINAYGGNLFYGGGEKKKFYEALNISNDEEFYDWVEDNNFGNYRNDPIDDSFIRNLIQRKGLDLIKASPTLINSVIENSRYNWNSFYEPPYTLSTTPGNSSNTYKIAHYDGNVKDLENSWHYKNFTDYIKKKASDIERYAYFKYIDDHTGNEENKYIINGVLREDWTKKFDDARNDGKYGIVHTQPEKFTQPVSITPTIEGLVLPTTSKSPVKEKDLKVHNPSVAGDDEVKYKSETARYAPIFTDLLSLGLMAGEVGRPDHSNMKANANSLTDVALATHKPVSGYLRYDPMDIMYEQNRLDANARATERAILNSGATSGGKMAGLLASNYNNQLASGELFKKALEYNDEKEAKVKAHNLGIDQFNAEAFNRLSQYNASALNTAKQARAQLMMKALEEEAQSDANWYASLYGNIGNLGTNLGATGKENVYWNMAKAGMKDGVYGNTGNSETNKLYRAKGGKIQRKKNKKGLTY